jgi:hypothetical protein
VVSDAHAHLLLRNLNFGCCGLYVRPHQSGQQRRHGTYVSDEQRNVALMNGRGLKDAATATTSAALAAVDLTKGW